GYTDSTGDRQENLKLSKDRAQAVADVLMTWVSMKNVYMSRATVSSSR
ncbi:OmpA protein, partial [Pseudomonas savastanoi pv. glycinea]